MKQWLFVAAVAIAAALLFGVTDVSAQSGVGNLRIVDETDAELGREQAPAGEKHFRLPVGTSVLRVAFDYEGSTPSPVQVRVMGPSGTTMHQSSEEYDASDTYVVEFDSGDQPYPEQEYVVNIYIGADPYLADSLQLVIGEGKILSSEELESATALPAEGQGEGVMELSEPQPVATSNAPSIPGGPSWQVLGLAALGIIALGVVVVWAAMSATKRS